MSFGHNRGDPNDPTDDTPFEALQSNSLKTAGWAYLVGDAAIVASGLLDKDYKRASVGAAWGLGGMAAARYGNPKAEKQLELLCDRLGAYLREEGVAIPKTPETKALSQQGGIVHHVESFLYAHPSEMLNAVYALGATQLVSSGVSSVMAANKAPQMTDLIRKNKNVAMLDAASGMLIGAGALAGLLIHEKHADPEHPPKTSFDKAVAWIQEKPLRLSGLFYHANNAAMLGAAIFDRNKGAGNNNYMWRFLTAGSYIFANTMLALSSKGHSEHSNELTSQLADVSARVVAAQPKEVQQALVQQISGYLASQAEIQMKAQDISAVMLEKLEKVNKEAPAQGHWQQLVSAPASPASPALPGA